MGKRTGLFVVLVVMVMVVCIGTSAFSAEDKKSFKQASEDAASATVNYPANLLNESVNVVGTAAKNTAGVVVDTVKVTGETLTGQPEKAPQIVTAKKLLISCSNSR